MNRGRKNTFQTKRNGHQCSFSVLTRFSGETLFMLMKIARALLFLAIYLDLGENSQGRDLS